MATTTLEEGEITLRHLAEGLDIPTDYLAQRPLAVHAIPLQAWRVHDAMQTNIGTPASDDLGITTGAYATGPAYVSAGDLKAAGATTRYARCQVALPANYEAGETVKLRVWAGMTTTVADTSCTVDVEAWRVDVEDGTLGAADLVSTSATSINSLTEDDKEFTVAGATLSPGDLLDVRVAVACNDAATATAVVPSIYAVQLLADVR